jgi:tRNA guanosine-2'-O-methyltransferase
VDEDPLTRKRTLYLLKQALPKLALQLNTAAEQVQRHPSGRQKKGMLGFQAHTTKKDVTCSQQNRTNVEEEELSNSSRDQQPPHAWKAFILLYETLEEYGSHLVEAVWAHEMVLLSPLSQNSKEFQTEENNTRGRRRNIIIQGIDVDYTWVLILFDRGFNHKNLQVRRLVLQSFLELDWANAFEIHACVSEEFMLGSLLTALDDPTHHRDFGKFPTFPI